MKKIEKIPPAIWLEELKSWRKDLFYALKQLKIEVTGMSSQTTITDETTTGIAKYTITFSNSTVCPPRLRIAANHGKVQYYIVQKGYTSSNGKFIKTKDFNFVKKLAQDNYNLQIIPILEEELKTIDKFISYFQKNSDFCFWNKMHPLRQQLITPVSMTNEQYAHIWSSISYSSKSFSNNSPVFITSRNLRVRSKSELLIAEALYRNNIPFRYEFPVKIGRYYAYPDFYCLNIHNRQELIWEHLGKMDDMEYIRKNVLKLQDYAKSGIVGKKLILSFELLDSPFTSQMAEDIIKYNFS